MKPGLNIWIYLLVPALLCGALAGFWSHWMTDSLWISATVMAACLFGAAATAWMVTRNEQEASALLRRPELRGSGSYKTGIYHNIIREAVDLLEASEAEARRAAEAKTELEARAHVRNNSLRRMQAAIESLDSPTFITDARGELQFWNAAALRLLRRVAGPAADGSDKPNLDRVPALRCLIEETKTRNAATDSRTVELDVTAGESTLPYRAQATNVYDGGGAFLGVAAVLTDIKDERLAKTRHAEFVSSVSHELKTPMAGIRAFIEMLIDGDVTEPDEQREIYGFIDVQVGRLTRLVNNMLNLARIESGVIKIQREDCELNDILNKAIGVVQPVADEKQIRIVSELSDLYMAVHVDSDLFGQAVINLLSNAVKYTPEGGEVRVRSRMDEGSAVVEFRDTGMGIPAASLPHIFERFYRVPENNKAAAGTGLGLALVHYVVTDVHGGRIAVDSVVDQGTCFTVTIPLGHRDQGRKRKEAALCTA